jgi:hypothetical protein
MKNKLFLFASLLVMTIVSSCGKYEDGPAFSLRSRTARLQGDWTLEEYAGQAASGSIKMTINKDGSYTSSSSFGSYTGTWKWTSSDEKVVFSSVLGDQTTTVTRLANKEFWYTDDNGDLYKWKQD